MQSISTKTGDKGESGLADGRRLPKSDPIFDVLGTLDELNSHLGLCVIKVGQKSILLEIQNTLFQIGAQIAGSAKTKLTEKQLHILENESERLQQSMEEGWLTKFLLPGGSESAATLDISRTVCRRLERLLVAHKTTPLIQLYINRLSDYLYVLRCSENQRTGKQENIFTYIESSR
ncbi:MAG TPA: cob(I)yrinic acid a,c-diamide adenosyltransferase [Patescibacteria group bacterium]|nr:cob(I)yrinic acid a,c-diamide adenosyltransferase [Patescibacteria group bacterium]